MPLSASQSPVQEAPAPGPTPAPASEAPAPMTSENAPPQMSGSLAAQKPRSGLVKPKARKSLGAGLGTKGHKVDPHDAENVGGNGGNGHQAGRKFAPKPKPMAWTTDGALAQDEEDAAAAAAEMKRGLARSAAKASKANSFSFVC